METSTDAQQAIQSTKPFIEYPQTPDASYPSQFQQQHEQNLYIESELLDLRKQIGHLQKTVDSMRNDSEKKGAALAKLARDKERLNIDLSKQKRSNSNLKQQLNDERQFYLREKEQYCQEMNDTKKMKQKLQQEYSNENLKEKLMENEKPLHRQINELQDKLQETLEANYNLSVKFLRMKNTKFCIKNQFKRLQDDHNKITDDYKAKLDVVEKNVNEIVDKEFLMALTPSSKKYLQIIKYNGHLIHENLSLQIANERLTSELDRYKRIQIKHDTHKKLKYINSKNRHNFFEPTGNVETSVCSTTDMSKTTDSSIRTSESQLSIKKIFEKTEKPGVPNITIMPLDNSLPIHASGDTDLSSLARMGSDESCTIANTVLMSVNDTSSLDLVNVSNTSIELNSLNSMSYHTSVHCGRPQSAPEFQLREDPT